MAEIDELEIAPVFAADTDPEVFSSASTIRDGYLHQTADSNMVDCLQRGSRHDVMLGVVPDEPLVVVSTDPKTGLSPFVGAEAEDFSGFSHRFGVTKKLPALNTEAVASRLQHPISMKVAPDIGVSSLGRRILSLGSKRYRTTSVSHGPIRFVTTRKLPEPDSLAKDKEINRPIASWTNCPRQRTFPFARVRP